MFAMRLMIIVFYLILLWCKLENRRIALRKHIFIKKCNQWIYRFSLDVSCSNFMVYTCFRKCFFSKSFQFFGFQKCVYASKFSKVCLCFYVIMTCFVFLRRMDLHANWDPPLKFQELIFMLCCLHRFSSISSI